MLKQAMQTGLLLVTLLMVMASAVQARMIMIKPGIYTNNNPGGTSLDLYVEVFNDNATHPPNYVTAISLVSPDGATLDINPLTSWDEVHKHFYASFANAVFGGTIPAGIYKVTVTDATGKITLTDDVNATILPLAVVTTPIGGSTIPSGVYTFSWGRVTGAKYYRVHLYDISRGEFIYSNAPGQRIDTALTIYTIPKGVLQPGRQYRMRIEARTDFPDMDKRSQSLWINFFTEPL